MKKIHLTIAIVFLVCGIALAQKGRGGETGKSIDDFNVSKDFEVASPKLIKNSEVGGIVKGALHFKSITSDLRYVGKGQERTTAKAWAILEGVSEQTMQEISDEFAMSFAKKIASFGIEMKDWKTITSSDNYEKLKEKEIEKVKSNPSTGYIDIKTANDGPHMKQVVGNPGIWGALAKVGKDFEGNAITYDINIDFARFDIDAERRVSSSVNYSTNIKTTTTSTKAEANVFPQISIEAVNGANGFGLMTTNLMFIGKYGEASIITLGKNIYLDNNYSVEVDTYQGKMPERMSRLFTFKTMTTGTFVVKADEAKYKAAVLSALDQYSDYLIELIKTEIR